ncbi:MAG TPA: transposase, partial [Actinomycetes bacterium]|nr:transposase [Actinomycetes bacterium]
MPSPSCTTQVRHAHGRNPEPSAGVIDSCSIKASPVRGPRGFDGAKKLGGIKRHVVVDTLGLLVAALVTAASVQDRAAVPRLLGRARYRCPRGSTICGRPGLHRQRRAGREQNPAAHDPDRRRDQAQGRLITQPRRWVVE